MNRARDATIWQLPAHAADGPACAVYQWTLSPLIGRHCRFEPTCSDYFILAVRKYGAIRGHLARPVRESAAAIRFIPAATIRRESIECQCGIGELSSCDVAFASANRRVQHCSSR